MTRWLTVASVLLVSGCASHTPLSPEDQASLDRDLARPERTQYLRVSYFVTPFFGDGSKRLLTAVPPDQVRLLNQTNGEPINPGPVEKLLPAGKRARIVKVEFPTSWVVTSRVVFTPRTQPWVYLAVEDEPKDVPYILVLRPQIKDQAEFLHELERYLTREDPQPRMAAWPQAVRDAVARKEVVAEMPAEAVEMAWGFPETKKISFEESSRKEKWIYPGKRRTATLVDGRLSESTDGK